MELHKISPKKKALPWVKKAYDIDANFDNQISLLKICESTYKEIIEKNINLARDPYEVSKKFVKSVLKYEYVAFWKEKLRNSPTSASYATHKSIYEMEPYLVHVAIKKHRNALAKLRLSDHELHIHSGRQTRPKTAHCLRFCKTCPEKIEDEAHFLCECKMDYDIKSDFLKLVAIKYPNIDDLGDKYQKYKFIMKIQDQETLRSLGYCINLLFKRMGMVSK